MGLIYQTGRQESEVTKFEEQGPSAEVVLRAVSKHCLSCPCVPPGDCVRDVSPRVGICKKTVYSLVVIAICHLTPSMTFPPMVTLLNVKALGPHSEVQTSTWNPLSSQVQMREGSDFPRPWTTSCLSFLPSLSYPPVTCQLHSCCCFLSSMLILLLPSFPFV